MFKQACRNHGGWGLQPTQIFAKVDLLRINYDGKKEKIAKKYIPSQIH